MTQKKKVDIHFFSTKKANETKHLILTYIHLWFTLNPAFFFMVRFRTNNKPTFYYRKQIMHRNLMVCAREWFCFWDARVNVICYKNPLKNMSSALNFGIVCATSNHCVLFQLISFQRKRKLSKWKFTRCYRPKRKCIPILRQRHKCIRILSLKRIKSKNA